MQEKAEEGFNLERFVRAQEGAFEEALSELRAGQKRSHWIWFIFPQRKGLGRSATSEFYGIGSMEEAQAYLKHPVLGLRLRECARAVNAVEGRTAEAIFGWPDDVKFRSSMTLFARAAEAAGNAEAAAEFRAGLDKYFGGEEDPETAGWEG
ncbi:MAG TPA: DUF1810 domain-containing protein [Terracidiphilus sp.]|nr:DUF1810 domain-containing protein [Terracidiphilus sp.]